MNPALWAAALLQPAIIAIMFLSAHTAATDEFYQYGVVGAVAAAELVGLVWLVKKWTGYMETQAQAATAATEKNAEALETLTNTIRDLAKGGRENRESEARHEERMEALISRMERTIASCPARQP